MTQALRTNTPAPFDHCSFPGLEEHLRRVLEHMPFLLTAFDDQGGCIYWNRETERLTGWSLEELKTWPDYPYVLPLLYPDQEYLGRIMHEWAQRGNNYTNWELELTRKDGEKRIMAFSSVSDFAPIPGWSSWSVGVDVTDRVHAQQAISHLVAGVAHEIRNPLFGISSTIESLQARLRNHPDLDPHFAVLKVEVERLKGFVQELLDYERPVVLRREILQPEDFMAAIAGAIKGRMGYRDLRCILEILGDPGPVSWDAHRVRQIIENLLLNAFQHSPPHGRVRLCMDKVGDQVVIQIEDQGAGFDPKDLPRIFEPYFSRRNGGMGLGLGIAHKFAQAHGGTLGAANTPEGGAVLTVTLPTGLAERGADAPT